MHGPHARLWRVVHADAPLGVVIYTDPASRAEWIEEMEALYVLAEEVPQRFSTADELFSRPGDPVFLLPAPEAETNVLERLAVGRDHLVARTAPATLFLLRAGPGLRVLESQAALASFLHGLIVDPAEIACVDLDRERQSFERDTGESVETWLRRHRAGEHADTLHHALLHLRALLLEAR